MIKKILDKIKILNSLRDWRYIYSGKIKIKKAITTHPSPLKIILGSYRDTYDGWISTDLPYFNIFKESDWRFYFKKNSINNLLAEHVLEHLSEKNVEDVLALAHKYLRSGGCFRIAVPDAYNPDPEYLDTVSPTGKIGSWYGHKSVHNYKTFSALAAKKKFEVKILEHFDENGSYFLSTYTDKNGSIARSGKNANAEKSLIVDCLKK